MQVFMPYSDFRKSLSCLDSKRLGNQIYRECLTLIKGKWKNHPVSKMWKGYEYALCEYALIGLDVLKKRGRNYPHWVEWFKQKQKEFPNTGKPFFIGNKKFHDSHKSNLLRKNMEYYKQFKWNVPNNLPYVWPSRGEV